MKSPPPMISNSTRRFCDQQDSTGSWHTAFSSPKLVMSSRAAGTPSAVRYRRALAARRSPSARLYSSAPRSSVCPESRRRSDGLPFRIDALRSSFHALPVRGQTGHRRSTLAPRSWPVPRRVASRAPCEASHPSRVNPAAPLRSLRSNRAARRRHWQRDRRVQPVLAKCASANSRRPLTE